MIVVGIDPGTRCGWCVMRDGEATASGSWDLRPKRHESPGMRFVRARTSIRALLQSERPQVVAYEEVRRHAGTSAAHVYGGLVAVIQTECIDLGVEHCAIPVGTAKKLATGKGNADKAAMLQAARATFGAHVASEDEADALWIARAAFAEIG